MKILGIETSGETSSVALVTFCREGTCAPPRRSARYEPAPYKGTAHVLERVFPSKMTLNQTLAAHVREVCGSDRLAEVGLDGVAVGIGPGSFTGVRMGVAAAKAIAHALKLPLVGVSAPQAMASALPAKPGWRICVMQEARANEVYATCLVTDQANMAAEVAPTEVLRVREALERAEKHLGGSPDLFCGDAARQCWAIIQSVFEHARLAGEKFDIARAAVMAEIAAALLGQADHEAAFSLRPRYVRLSQAERERGVDLHLTQ